MSLQFQSLSDQARFAEVLMLLESVCCIVIPPDVTLKDFPRQLGIALGTKAAIQAAAAAEEAAERAEEDERVERELDAAMPPDDVGALQFSVSATASPRQINDLLDKRADNRRLTPAETAVLDAATAQPYTPRGEYSRSQAQTIVDQQADLPGMAYLKRAPQPAKPLTLGAPYRRHID